MLLRMPSKTVTVLNLSMKKRDLKKKHKNFSPTPSPLGGMWMKRFYYKEYQVKIMMILFQETYNVSHIAFWALDKSLEAVCYWMKILKATMIQASLPGVLRVSVKLRVLNGIYWKLTRLWAFNWIYPFSGDQNCCVWLEAFSREFPPALEIYIYI